MTLLDRLARAVYRDDYPAWPEQWDDLKPHSQAHTLKKAEQVRRVMSVALRDGDELGNGLTARASEGRRSPAVAKERERCAAIADAEAAEAYRNPRAANYRSPEMEKMARYTAERIAKLIRAGVESTTEPRGQNADDR